MKFRTTALLLFIVAGAIAYIAWVERAQQSTTERSKSAHLLATVNPDEVYEIKIEDATGVSRIRRENGVWNVVIPYKDRADQEYAEAVINFINHLEIRTNIASADEITGLDAFGASAKTITLKKDKNTNLVLVTLGKPAGFKDTVYAKNLNAKNPSEILVVHSDQFDLLARPPSEYRDPRLIPFSAGDITKLGIRNQSGEIELERTAGVGEDKIQWWLTKPLSARADNKIVAEKIAALTSIRVKSRATGVSGSTSPPVFDQLSTRITVWRDNDEKDPVKIAFLITGEGDDRTLLAKVSGRKHVFEAQASVLDSLTLKPNDLRDDTLAAIDEKRVNTLLIQSAADPEVPLFKVGGHWSLIRNGQREEADGARIARLISELNDNRILEFTDDAATDLAPYGLANPFVEITFSSARMEVRDDVGTFPITPENSTTLRLGQGPKNRIHANFAGEPFVYTISPTILNAVPTHPIKWKSRRIADFSLIDLRKITLTQGVLPPFVLSVDISRNTWKATRPGVDLTAQLDLGKALDYAENLTVFHADDWITDRAGPLEVLAKSPSLRIDIEVETIDFENAGKKKSETITLRFAPTAPGELGRFYYGARDGDPEVFLVSRETYQSLLISVLKD